MQNYVHNTIMFHTLSESLAAEQSKNIHNGKIYRLSINNYLPTYLTNMYNIHDCIAMYLFMAQKKILLKPCM